MPRAAATAPKKRPGPKATKLAEEFAKGTVITDVLKKQWRLREVIGQGGFGLVYFADSVDSSSREAQYVIKIEPGANGPLFCEMNFYIRAAKREFIQDFIKSHKLKYLAVPPYVGSGLHTYNSKSYRFLVMQRYGTDLQKLLQAAGGTFPNNTVFAIGMRMVDALQYLHEREYVHADVKASNILLGFNGHSEDKDQVYLADYGLAYRYTANNQHKEYKVDPRSAHNGTIEFTSRDAHRGVFPSRRGDLEILGFCLLQWMCGKLPWESNLANPVLVAGKKEECLKDVRSFVKSCLPGPVSAASDCMTQFFQEVNKLDYDEEPNYRKMKDILKTGLAKGGQKDEWKVGFTTQAKASKRKSQDSAVAAVSPKKRTMAVKKGPKASPASQKGDATSPLKKRSVPPKKSPSVNSKSNGSVRAVVKTGTKGKSPRGRPVKATPSPKSPVKSPSSPSPRRRIGTSKPLKAYQIPAPSKRASPKKSPGTPRQKAPAGYVRKVRRANVVRTDASIQTTPGLSSNI